MSALLSHETSGVFFHLCSTRPWDPLNDMIQYEKDGVIQTKVKHRTPMVCTQKVIRLPVVEEHAPFSSPTLPLLYLQ